MAMAKAKGKPGSRKAGRPKTVDHERVTVINLKGSPALRDWLAGLSDRTMIPAARITRAALALWAKSEGHPAPPKG